MTSSHTTTTTTTTRPATTAERLDGKRVEILHR